MSNALERLKSLRGNVQPNINISLAPRKGPWIDIDYPRCRPFISKGKSNVLGERSDVVNKAKRLYVFDDNDDNDDGEYIGHYDYNNDDDDF